MDLRATTELANQGQPGRTRHVRLVCRFWLGSGVDGGARLRVRDYKRRAELGEKITTSLWDIPMFCAFGKLGGNVP